MGSGIQYKHSNQRRTNTNSFGHEILITKMLNIAEQMFLQNEMESAASKEKI